MDKSSKEILARGRATPPFLAMPGFWEHMVLQPLPYKTHKKYATCKMRIYDDGELDDNNDDIKQEFKKFCGNLSMEQVNAAFKAFDLSGDNQLDYDEFCKLMNNR